MYGETVNDTAGTRGPHRPVEDPDVPGWCKVCPLPVRHKIHTAGPPPTRTPPLARNTDPESSHEAAALLEPRRNTAKGRVLGYLRARRGQWVDAIELTLPDVGGFAGTRRMRELRENDGWPIETRRKPGSESTWQHRLPPVEDE